MTTMAEQDVKELIKAAARAAKSAPEHLQEIAFSKAFDALAGDTSSPGSKHGGARRKKTSNQAPDPERRDRQQLMDGIDRTAHPEISHDQTGLDNALRLLRAAKDDLGIDGLSAAEIAGLLTNKFRAPITRQAVGRALNAASRYVDRHKEGSAVLFRIMGPGESYLETDQDAPSGPKKAPAKRKQAPAKRSRQGDAKPKVKTGAKKSAAAKGKLAGPSVDFGHLYDTGFFSKPRTIGAITAEIKDKQGRAYKSNEISPILLRYLRNDRLIRDRNEENQYEYSQA